MAEDLGFKDLVFTYNRSGGIPALRGASGCLPARSTVGLIGPNGAGKSTLCKVLNGVLRAQSGSIYHGGQVIAPFKQPGGYVAYAFQNPDDQLFLPTVREELMFGPKNLRLGEVQVRDAVNSAMELFHIAKLAECHPMDLPFVLRKRVVMASAAAMQRPYLVLDEPTLGQDPEYCDELVRIARSLNAASTSLIIISHDAEFAFEVCSYFMIMDSGRCVWFGTRQEMLAKSPNEAHDFVNVPGRLVRDLQLPSSLFTRAALANYFR